MAKWLDDQRLQQLEDKLVMGGVEAFARQLYEWSKTGVLGQRDFEAAIALACGAEPKIVSMIRNIERVNKLVQVMRPKSSDEIEIRIFELLSKLCEQQQLLIDLIQAQRNARRDAS